MAALSPHYGSKTSSSLPSPPLSPRTHNVALASYSPQCVEYEFCELRMYGVLGSSVLPWCSVVLSAMAHRPSPKTGVCCLRYVTGRGSDTFLPSPLYREAVSL